MNKEKTNENGTKQAPGNGFAITLLETGRNAFPEIIRQIRTAGQEIILHMFIWREDRIGLEIAGELLKAADRGVSIVIEKDRYGLLLEYGEESQRSFCHSPDLWERIQIKALCLFCNRDLYRNRLQTDRCDLYRRLKEHPNVIMTDNRKTEDHSKYFIFDRQIMILGGINIEDKEYFRDAKGRVYFDYMVRISDSEIISRFLEKRESPKKKNDLFLVNMKEPVRNFELKKSFLELIDEAERELGKTDGKLSVFLTDYMLHAKLIMNEKRILTGSCNINHKSFNRLGELCITVNNDDSPFACQVRTSVEELFRSSAQAENRRDIRFNPFMAAIEMTIMR